MKLNLLALALIIGIGLIGAGYYLRKTNKLTSNNPLSPILKIPILKELPMIGIKLAARG